MAASWCGAHTKPSCLSLWKGSACAVPVSLVTQTGRAAHGNSPPCRRMILGSSERAGSSHRAGGRAGRLLAKRGGHGQRPHPPHPPGSPQATGDGHGGSEGTPRALLLPLLLPSAALLASISRRGPAGPAPSSAGQVRLPGQSHHLGPHLLKGPPGVALISSSSAAGATCTQTHPSCVQMSAGAPCSQRGFGQAAGTLASWFLEPRRQRAPVLGAASGVPLLQGDCTPNSQQARSRLSFQPLLSHRAASPRV